MHQLHNSIANVPKKWLLFLWIFFLESGSCYNLSTGQYWYPNWFTPITITFTKPIFFFLLLSFQEWVSIRRHESSSSETKKKVSPTWERYLDHDCSPPAAEHRPASTSEPQLEADEVARTTGSAFQVRWFRQKLTLTDIWGFGFTAYPEGEWECVVLIAVTSGPMFLLILFFSLWTLFFLGTADQRWVCCTWRSVGHGCFFFGNCHATVKPGSNSLNGTE